MRRSVRLLHSLRRSAYRLAALTRLRRLRRLLACLDARDRRAVDVPSLALTDAWCAFMAPVCVRVRCFNMRFLSSWTKLDLSRDRARQSAMVRQPPPRGPTTLSTTTGTIFSTWRRLRSLLTEEELHSLMLSQPRAAYDYVDSRPQSNAEKAVALIQLRMRRGAAPGEQNMDEQLSRSRRTLFLPELRRVLGYLTRDELEGALTIAVEGYKAQRPNVVVPVPTVITAEQLRNRAFQAPSERKKR